MIFNNMRLYDYVKIQYNEDLGTEYIPAINTPPLGQVKLSIYPTSTGTQENILYSNCNYVGLTLNSEIDDKYIIQYGKERLKVMYVQPNSRIRQVFLKRVN